MERGLGLIKPRSNGREMQREFLLGAPGRPSGTNVDKVPPSDPVNAVIVRLMEGFELKPLFKKNITHKLPGQGFFQEQ